VRERDEEGVCVECGEGEYNEMGECREIREKEEIVIGEVGGEIWSSDIYKYSIEVTHEQI
jgi:hypothetical protein